MSLFSKDLTHYEPRSASFRENPTLNEESKLEEMAPFDANIDNQASNSPVKKEKEEEVTENSDVYLPSNDDLAKIKSSSLYIRATGVIKDAQNLSNKVERTENVSFKDGCHELEYEIQCRTEISNFI